MASNIESSKHIQSTKHIQLKDHLDYVDYINKIFAEKKFDQLLNFTNFCIGKLIITRDINYLNRANNKIIKHFFDNAIDLILHYNYFVSYVFAALDMKLVYYFDNKYQLDVNSSEYMGNRPIHYLRLDIHLEKIKYLIKRGISLDPPNINGLTPLDMAIDNGALGVVQLLLDNGIQIETNSERALNIFNSACYKSTAEIIYYLLDMGIITDINAMAKITYSVLTGLKLNTDIRPADEQRVHSILVSKKLID